MRGATRRDVGVDRGRWRLSDVEERRRPGSDEPATEASEEDGNVNSSRRARRRASGLVVFVARGPRAWHERGNRSEERTQGGEVRRGEVVVLDGDGIGSTARRHCLFFPIPKFPRPDRNDGRGRTNGNSTAPPTENEGVRMGSGHWTTIAAAGGAKATPRHARNLLAGPDRKGLLPGPGPVAIAVVEDTWGEHERGQKKCLLILPCQPRCALLLNLQIFTNTVQDVKFSLQVGTAIRIDGFMAFRVQPESRLPAPQNSGRTGADPIETTR